MDDKGNSYLLLKAAEQLASAGELPVNVRIAFDGEEETGGHSIVEFLEADERGADACIIFDSGMPREDVPSFDLGTRGLIYFHVRLSSGERDLHSGMFGGAALNAVHALMQTLEAVVAVPDELRAGVAPATEEERRSWRELDPGADVLAAEGARPMDPAAAEDFYLRTLAGPARGRERPRRRLADPPEDRASGGQPRRTSPSGSRLARTSTRSPLPSSGSFARRRPKAPSSRSSAGRLLPRGSSRPTPRRSSSAQDAFEHALGRRPLLLRTGGTLPIVPALADKGIPTILTGFALPGANVHSPNERLLARYIPLGVAAARETLLAFKAL